MANRKGHRRFGSIRKRASGQYQARYLGPDGMTHSAPQTFARKSEAERFLSLIETQLARNEWINPARGKVKLTDYAENWIKERPRLRPRTVELYNLLLRLHIAPYFGDAEISSITTPMVRSWRATLVVKSSDAMAAKAYRLLRAVFNTAMKEDEMIRQNPCRIPGADKEHSAERPVMSVPQVLALAEAVPARYRALVVLSAFACLRWGEAIALNRSDLDLKNRRVRVNKAYSELTGSEMVVALTKSRAGVRTVTFPAFVLPYVEEHLKTFTAKGDQALIFTSPKGNPLRRSNFRGASKWATHCENLGMPGFHFHDLRHTGNTLAARTGASLRDLMSRMGHDSPRAALIYQHASEDADRAIADALDLLVKPVSKDADGEDGAAGAMARVS